MTESLTSTKLAKWWKRPLIGGLLFMLVVVVTSGLGWGIVTLSNLFPYLDILMWPTLFFLFIIVGFVAPAELMGLGLDDFASIPASLIFWFLAGALIAYLDKNTKRAVIWWILLLIALIFARIYYIGMPM